MSRTMKRSGVPWLGDMPAGWKIAPLSQLTRRVDNPNEGMAERNLLSLSHGRIVRKDMETASGLVPQSYAGYNRIQPDDIVLRLTDLQNDQRSLRVGLSHDRGIVTAAYLTVRPSDECSPDYLAYAIKVFDFRKGFYGIGSGVRQSLKFNEIKRILFPIPPLPQQRRIAAFLDGVVAKIDGIRDKIQREIEHLGDYKKSLIAETVCHGIRGGNRPFKPSGIPWLGNVPAEWEVMPLSQLTHQVRDPNEGMVERNLLSLSYGRIIRKDMETASGLVPENYAGYNRIQPDDIVLRLTDLQNDQRSLRVGLSKDRGIVTSAYLTIRPIVNCCPDYVAYAIKVFDFRKGFYGIGSGVRQTLKFNEVKRIQVPLPSIPEQCAIADYLDRATAAIDAAVEARKGLLEKLDALKKTTIMEYTTGKKEVLA